MDLESYLRFLAALILVIGLIGAIAWVVRRLGLAGRLPAIKGRAARRLGVVEFMALDPKTRMVLVRRDETQHLILLGANGPVVVERGIDAPAEAETTAERSADTSPDTTPNTAKVEAAE